MNYSIGIDVGGTNTDIGLVGNDGSCVARSHISTAQYDNAEKYVNDLTEAVKNLIAKWGNETIVGIGIGAPNGNYYTGCIEDAPNLRFRGNVFLKKMLEDRVNMPVVITNDANAAAYGEMIYGGAKGMYNFIMFTLGTGVGSGIVVDGKLLYGHDGFAGELGHTIVVPAGRPCKCGRSGCLEQYTSAGGIVKTCIEMLRADKGHSVLAEVPVEKLTCKMIGEAANQGDELSVKVFEKTGDILGLSIANAVAFSSPEAIFLMGGPVNVGDVLLNPTKKSFEANVLSNYKGKVPIRVSELNRNDAAILGAAALVM